MHNANAVLRAIQHKVFNEGRVGSYCVKRSCVGLEFYMVVWNVNKHIIRMFPLNVGGYMTVEDKHIGKLNLEGKYVRYLCYERL